MAALTALHGWGNSSLCFCIFFVLWGRQKVTKGAHSLSEIDTRGTKDQIRDRLTIAKRVRGLKSASEFCRKGLDISCFFLRPFGMENVEFIGILT